MMRVFSSVFGRIGIEEAPSLLPDERIKLINLSVSDSFDENNCVPPRGVYSLFLPKIEIPGVRTIPILRIKRKCAESAESGGLGLIIVGLGAVISVLFFRFGEN